jgi:peptidoglycan/xylan/chitin deacetylase (PgdA/CDA1 family)
MAYASFGVKALLGLGLLGLAAQPALAASCPGNPDAIGTSRTIVVDPREHPRIGTMQYPETLPLQDHEVVLTFDDGPIPKHSNAILAILAAQCVQATFFEIGRMAQEHPEGVRKLIAAGHSVGTHTQNHPLTMNRLPIEAAQKEIDDGIASVTAALADPAQLSPFLRIPGLLRAGVVEDYLASKGIQTWSADFPADDWRHVSSKTVHDLAISRIKAKGKGILLLHDIQPRTVAALPGILADLKAGGFRIVHVVAATPTLPKTPTELQEWRMHPTSETVAISHWQKVPSFAYAHLDMLPAPAMSESDQTLSFPENFRRPRGAALPAPWPRESTLQAMTGTATLPVPAQNLFEISEHHGPQIKAMVQLPHHAWQQAPARTDSDAIARIISLDASAARRTIPGSLPVTRPGLQPGPLMLR